MSSDEDARSAIEKLNGRTFQGRNRMVNEARPLERSARRNRNPFGATNAKGRRLVGFRHLNQTREKEFHTVPGRGCRLELRIIREPAGRERGSLSQLRIG
jgi:hypothetical protein